MRGICGTIFFLVLFQLVAFCDVPKAHSANITTFDAPGADPSLGTFPDGINSAGVITGYYYDVNGFVRGFIRRRSGKFTTFEARRSAQGQWNTLPTSINAAGEISGSASCFNPPICNGAYGFVRSPNGKFVYFQIPNHGVNTSPQSIGASGVTAGVDDEGSFVRRPDGKFAAFRVDDDFANASSINSFGAVTGVYASSITLWRGFLRSRDGTITTFDAPGSISGQSTYPASINASGTITGFYGYGNQLWHSFLRYADGSFVEFDPPDSTGSQAASINRTGQITGYYNDDKGIAHGFVREPNGTFVDVDAPDAGGSITPGTYPLNINDRGAITGYFYDKNDLIHGFIRTP